MLIKRPMVLLAVCFVLTAYLYTMLTGGIDLKEYVNDGSTIVISGKIIDKFYKNNQNTLHIISNKKKYSVVLSSNSKSYSYYKIGQKVKVKGKYANFKIAENDGQFDSRKFYRIRGFEAQIKKAEILDYSEKYDIYREGLHNVRKRVENVYKKYLSDKEAATLSALCLGDKNEIDEDVKETYQNAGISHLLSLSGLHIATLGLMLFSFIRRIGVRVVKAAIIVGAVMFSYSVMTGMSTSTKRALIMYTAAVISKCLKRTYDLLSALSLSILLIICENPYYMFDSGVLLSFFAVFSIAIFNPVVKEIMDDLVCSIERMLDTSILRTDNKILNVVMYSLSGLCVSISVMIITLPIVMNFFYKTARYGLILNIIVVPLMTIVLVCGILGGIMGVAGLYITDITSDYILQICESILMIYYKLAKYFQSIKGNTWVLGKPEKINIIVYIIIIMLTITFYNTVKKRLTSDKRNIKKTALNITTMLIITISVYIISQRDTYDIKIITMSVGQGSCNIIYGKDLPVIIYDGGSSDVKNVGKYRIIPCLLANGLNQVDYVFISHNDADHINGIKELLSIENSGITVKNVIMSYEDEEVCELCRKNRIEVYIISKGDSIEGNNFQIRCISPASDYLNEALTNDVNEASLVIEYFHKPTNYKMLFTGDITSAVEERLLPVISKYNYVTVCHHGSKYSNSSEFLKKTNADIYTISAGKGNSYGHPHSETIKRLTDLNLTYFRTDECGQITTIVNRNKVILKKYY